MSATAAKVGDLILSKGEAARELNVSPGRVSQYIAEGKIYGAAIVGEGRSAKINVDLARQQLRSSLDIGQRFGNGIATDLSDREVEVVADDPAEERGTTEETGDQVAASRLRERLRVVDPTEEAIKLARLQSIQYGNREKAEAELARRGTYLRTDEVAAAMSKIAGSMLNVFEGGLADLATAVSAQFKVPQRDALHLLRSEFVKLRAKAAEAARRAGNEMPALKADDVAIEGEEDN